MGVGDEPKQESYDKVGSWEWVKRAVEQLAEDEPEKVQGIVEEIVKVVRQERPDLFRDPPDSK